MASIRHRRRLGRDAPGLRVRTGSGYAVAHKDLSLDLPENYAFTFRIRGACAANHLEFKLIDSTGENVWWSVRRDVRFPNDWETYKIKKRQISFAWGPQGGGEIRHVAAIEFAITPGLVGAGSVWIDELRNDSDGGDLRGAARPDGEREHPRCLVTSPNGPSMATRPRCG